MLENRNKNKGFKIPENYFANFNENIMSQLPEKEKVVTVKKIPIWRRISTWSAAAAVFVAVSIVGFNFLESRNHANTDVVDADNKASLQSDYYKFIEDEATQIAYQDSFYE